MKVLVNKSGIVDKSFLSRSIGQLNPQAPLIIHQDDSIAEAIKILQDNRVGAVVIVDDEGVISGIFTERDVTLKICNSGIDKEKTPVSEYMTKDPHTEDMLTPVAFALNMMSQGGYRHIPIVDEEKVPVGMLSVKDIVDYIVGEMTRDLSNTAEGDWS